MSLIRSRLVRVLLEHGLPIGCTVFDIRLTHQIPSAVETNPSECIIINFNILINPALLAGCIAFSQMPRRSILQQ